MKTIKRTLAAGIVAGILLFTMTSCRIVDFTIISSKNVSFNVKKDAPRVKGWGFTLKAAIDKAIEKAGPGYDCLVDGVVSQGIPFGFNVKGTPVKSGK